MPSSIAHALAAGVVGTPLAPATATRRYWIAGILCAVLPDVDAIGRPFGRGDLEFLGGHRGLTHGLLFAVALGTVGAWFLFRHSPVNGSLNRIAVFLILATVSHGFLDMFASYGDGVAFFFPFSSARYSAPWRPLREFNEVWWIWLPAIAVIIGARRLRRTRSGTGGAAVLTSA